MKPKVATLNRRPQVEIVDFGAGGVLLLAEYDVETDTIRVNARAIERVRLAAGVAQAAAFVTCAIAHEHFHRAYPDAPEASAHEHASRTTGGDPRRFESYARGASRERV